MIGSSSLPPIKNSSNHDRSPPLIISEYVNPSNQSDDSQSSNPSVHMICNHRTNENVANAKLHNNIDAVTKEVAVNEKQSASTVFESTDEGTIHPLNKMTPSVNGDIGFDINNSLIASNNAQSTVGTGNGDAETIFPQHKSNISAHGPICSSTKNNLLTSSSTPSTVATNNNIGENNFFHEESVASSSSAHDTITSIRKDTLILSSGAPSTIDTENGDEDDDIISVQTEQSNDDNPSRRRTSTRPRKMTQKAVVMDDVELDKLLESTRVSKHRTAFSTDQRVEELEKWVELEKIIKLQRITTPSSEPESGNSSCLSSIQQYAHFVKFRDQSYWHCNWVPGSTLLCMHPLLVRNFHRLHRNQLEEADFEYEKNSSGDCSARIDPKIPSSDDDSAEEREDDEKTTNYIIGGRLSVPRIGPQPKQGRGRYFYYIDKGIDFHHLYPDMVIEVGEEFKAILFTNVRKKDKKKIRKSDVYNTKMREVLVKWTHLDESQATWETVERDLECFETMLPKYRKAGRMPLDPCGRRLLPNFVRRWILQLTEELYVLRANLFSAHLRTGSRKDMAAALASPKKTTPSLPFIACQQVWNAKWIDKQPEYLSKYEGGKLHPYQLEGVRWLRHSFYNGVNTILADEMGLGKTVQVIAMLYSLLKEDGNPGPVLIVAPLSTVLNWEREFKFWAPDMRVIVYIGDKKNRAMIKEFEFFIPNSKHIPAFHVIITSYELASLEKASLQNFPWSVLIVDEAHRLKNKQSRCFRDLSVYDVGFKILLTGTPLQNNLEELFHLLNFMDSSRFSDFKSLSNSWASLSKEERVGRLHEMLKCHLLRRLKCDVIADLPKKTEILIPLDLTLFQKRLYKLILTKNYEELRSGNLMYTLVHLQKVCNHPYLIESGDEIAPRFVNGDYEAQALVQVSSKLDLVMRMLPMLHAKGHRVLIFCHFIGMLDLIEIALQNSNFSYERIDGSVRGHLRQQTIDRFNSETSSPFVFLLSTRAGGEGINLATADTVILYDSDWNPHCDLQALARAHRIGQLKHVLIYRLVTRSTVEERILQVAHKKLALSKLLIDPRNRQKTGLGKGVREDSLASGAVNPSRDSGLRLSRSEAHDILKNGISVLFANDDDDDDAIMDLDNVNILQSSAERVETDTPLTIPADDSEVLDDELRIKTDPKLIPLIYDDEALTRLLDREHRLADEEVKDGLAEDYLSVFKSAHFSTDDSREQLENSGTTSPIPSALSSIQSNYKSGDISALQNQGIKVGKTELTHFWDRLLRKRHEQLMASTGERDSNPSTNRFRASTSNSNPAVAVSRHHDCDTPPMVQFVSDSDASAADYEEQSLVDHEGEDVGDLQIGEVFLPVPGNSLLSNVTTSITVKKESGLKMVFSSHRNRKSRRVPKPTSSSLSNFHRVSRGEGTSDNRRSAEVRGGIRRQRNDGSDENDEVENIDEGVLENRREDFTDPSYDPLEDDEDLSDASFASRRLKNSKKQKMQDNGEPHCEMSLELLNKQLKLADAYRNIDWGNADKVYSYWTRMSNQLSGDDVKWSEEDGGSGKMTIFGFNAHDRQMFLDSVMRYGLPPDGILPPQDWMPHALRTKPPINLYAYTSLFMQHLYADPQIMDESALEWSDGLPKEGVSGLTVLSRIAMMALIRHKVIQFEDFNAIPRRYRTMTDNRFRFTIHEGGLTVLNGLWRCELADLGKRYTKANENFSRLVHEGDSASRQRRLYSIILRRWHHRHDFWLLAGIHVHGYAAWTEILADRRFNMLILGLAGQVMPTVGDADPFCLTKSDIELSNELRETFAFSAEVHCFLLDRLRLLEQALMVEESLFGISLAAVAGPKDTEQLRIQKATSFLSRFAKMLNQMSPRKHVMLPADIVTAREIKAGVEQLHLLLEDIYADQPGLPATLTCIPYDRGISKIQPGIQPPVSSPDLSVSMVQASNKREPCVIINKNSDNCIELSD